MRVADAGIVNGRVEATTEARQKIWAKWTAYCKLLRVPPYLDDCDFETVARVSTMFGGYLRQGKKGKPVKSGSVSAGLGGVSTSTQIMLDMGEQPLHQWDGSTT